MTLTSYGLLYIGATSFNQRGARLERKKKVFGQNMQYNPPSPPLGLSKVLAVLTVLPATTSPPIPGSDGQLAWFVPLHQDNTAMQRFRARSANLGPVMVVMVCVGRGELCLELQPLVILSILLDGLFGAGSCGQWS
jgi:hypothetical protein